MEGLLTSMPSVGMRVMISANLQKERKIQPIMMTVGERRRRALSGNQARGRRVQGDRLVCNLECDCAHNARVRLKVKKTESDTERSSCCATW